MALPVLDGNQSATTLSSVVTGGEHIVAHSVVSLGANAISDITSAVSGVPISGTVTANPVFQNNFFANSGIASDDGGSLPSYAVQIGFDTGSGEFATVKNSSPFPISGTVTVGNVEGWGIPLHDYRSFSYSGGNLSTIAYKTGGASGTTVGILTLAYDGSGNLTSMTKS